MLFTQHQKLVFGAGFTLIELLVSIALFSIVMTISVGTLLSIVDANRKAQSLRIVTDNLAFALDSMTRTIRTGYSIDCDPTAVGQAAGATEVNDCAGGSVNQYLALTDQNGKRVVYSVSGNTVFRDVDAVGPQAMTSPELKITKMQFYVSGTSPNDGIQPRVTVIIQGTSDVGKGLDTKFNIETTATQRLLDSP